MVVGDRVYLGLEVKGAGLRAGLRRRRRREGLVKAGRFRGQA
jgi:hypothetical protein